MNSICDLGHRTKVRFTLHRSRATCPAQATVFVSRNPGMFGNHSRRRFFTFVAGFFAFRHVSAKPDSGVGIVEVDGWILRRDDLA